MNDLVKDNLFKSISAIILEARKNVRTSVNSAMVMCYWNIGRLIVEDEQKGEQRAEYGKVVLQDLSGKLMDTFGKGYTVTNLRYMRQFYVFFPDLFLKNGIHHALRDELSWTHYRLLFKVEKEKARLWYMNEAVKENWSTRALERQINSFYYERLLSSSEKKPVLTEGKEKTASLSAEDVIKDPYVLEFLNLKNQPYYTEGELESALIDNLQNFLLELGAGFSFVARQKHLDLDGEHFYIDLVFYNYKLKCFVLIDLKRGKLTHQDIGQMDTYIRIYEDRIKEHDDSPTLGIILCADKNETVVKYSMIADSKQLFASKYKLYLPSEEELERVLSRELYLLEKRFEYKATNRAAAPKVFHG